ncbi:C-type lectin 17, partial [Operophtera brumata]
MLMKRGRKSAADRPKFRPDYRYEKAFRGFYKLHQSASSWAEARIRCQAEGSELLVPDSLDEADSVPLLVTSILHRFEGIFVGIHDLYSERSFVTIKGSVMLVSILNLLWEVSQPEYNGGRCVAMRRTGRLFVHPCADPLPFLCKVTTDNIKYNEECDTFDP